MNISSHCKICSADARFLFDLPSGKKSGHPIPLEPSDIKFYECSKCGFLFTRDLDLINPVLLYGDDYWNDQDPDWYGRVSETTRLVMLGLHLCRKLPNDCNILDFGCGMGAAVEVLRKKLDMKCWGTDMIVPRFCREYFLPTLSDKKFDIIVACEVIEHLPDPIASFSAMRAALNPGGAIAFQTAYWDGACLDRTWWYLGPGNGHISHYAPKTFDFIADTIGATKRISWNGYPGVQAWGFE